MITRLGTTHSRPVAASAETTATLAAWFGPMNNWRVLTISGGPVGVCASVAMAVRLFLQIAGHAAGGDAAGRQRQHSSSYPGHHVSSRPHDRGPLASGGRRSAAHDEQNPPSLPSGCRLVDSARNNGQDITATGNAGPSPWPGKPARRGPPDSSRGDADHQAQGSRPDPDARTRPDQPDLRASSGPDRRDRSSAERRVFARRARPAIVTTRHRLSGL
jgi:hypothetical protein